MKSISFRQFVVAVLAVTVFCACTRDEEWPAKESSFKATAAPMSATRVGYSVNPDHSLSQMWKAGDLIFGFDDAGNAFQFSVLSVAADGTATLSVHGYDPGEATTLYAVYYPGKSAFSGTGTARTLDVNLTGQDGTFDNNPPFILTSTATIADNAVTLNFENATAILSLDQFTTGPDEMFNSLTVSGLKSKGTLQVVGGVLRLVPASTTDDIIITFPQTITTNAAGVCSEPIYFTAVPTSAATMSFKTTAFSDIDYTYTFDKASNIAAANYYYMNKVFTGNYIPDPEGVAAVIYNGESVGYPTLDAAITAANNKTSDCELKLLSDFAVTATKSFTKGSNGRVITLNLNNHTITGDAAMTAAVIETKGNMIFKGGSANRGKIVANGRQVVFVNGTGITATFAGGTYVTNTTLASNSAQNNAIYGGGSTTNQAHLVFKTGAVVINNGSGNVVKTSGSLVSYAANLTIEGGEFSNPNSKNECITITGNVGTILISGGYFSGGGPCIRANKTNDITITGGYFNAGGTSATLTQYTGDVVHVTYHVSGGYYSAAPSSDYLTDGYAVIPNDDPTYVCRVAPM